MARGGASRLRSSRDAWSLGSGPAISTKRSRSFMPERARGDLPEEVELVARIATCFHDGSRSTRGAMPTARVSLEPTRAAPRRAARAKPASQRGGSGSVCVLAKLKRHKANSLRTAGERRRRSLFSRVCICARQTRDILRRDRRQVSDLHRCRRSRPRVAPSQWLDPADQRL